MAGKMELQSDLSLTTRFLNINWGLFILLILLACVGFSALYSAADGNFNPWATRQIFRFGIASVGMIIIALIDIKWWQRLAYPCYLLGLILLIIVEIMGHVGMGAQRWIDLGFMQLQPSELMKIVVIMALARYFHGASLEETRKISFLVIPAIMVLAPIALVLLQPDLGTALMIGFAGASVFLLAGVSLWIFGTGIGLAIACAPIAWTFLHDYQKQRIITFMNPEADPLGAGYHIMQSKIAIGSGGVTGKGFLKGTQGHLNFLPEKQTDFIFTLWAEEWGFIGGLAVLALLAIIFIYCGMIALSCRHSFGKLLSFGLMVNFSLYAFINIAMVMGLIPVVGAPLPLVSYGGTAMLAVMIGFGLIMSCSINKDAKLPRL
jgi:rod shape determining protein RodA